LLDDDGDGQGSLEPAPSSGDGALARRFVLNGVPADRQVAASSDSTLAPLSAEVRKLEEEVATLRSKKGSLPADVYDRELEGLLLKLSQKSAELRAKEEKR
jgi:hypothetical protein